MAATRRHHQALTMSPRCRRRLKKIGCGKIATVIGRYYAMDRDRRWERIQRATILLVKGVGARAQDPVKAIRESYQRGVTDEFNRTHGRRK